MARTPRMDQIEAMLKDNSDDAFLRYGLAMEHASAGDDAACATVLRELIALKTADPYIPAYLQAGQALARLDRTAEACDVLRAGLDAAKKVGTPEAMHAHGEMLGLLSSIE
jgi:predicted Zn-dependent protease